MTLVGLLWFTLFGLFGSPWRLVVLFGLLWFILITSGILFGLLWFILASTGLVVLFGSLMYGWCFGR